MPEHLNMKCNVCGAPLVFQPTDREKECEFCHNWSQRPSSAPEGVKSLVYANERRNMGEFEEAERSYRRVLEANPEEYEARWGLLLCKYGVIYVESASGERIITCRRTCEAALTAEDDYERLLTQVTSNVRARYERDAREIDAIQREILRIRRTAEPYDVFLCYKETAPEGGRTEDSLIAREIYDQLSKDGYRVFFAPMVMGDRVGANYEAVIFCAVETAPVMAVIGTRKEYFDSTWVRSEWRRFLDLKSRGVEKHLLVFYRNLDPGTDLPAKLRGLQAAELPLLRSQYIVEEQVKRVLPIQREEDPLEVGFVYLEIGSFSDAAAFFAQQLANQPRNARIWLGKAMAELQVPDEESLSATPGLLTNPSIKAALRFGDAALAERLRGYAQSAEAQQAETAKQAEAQRQAEAAQRLEEAQRQAEEKARQAEAARQAEEARQAASKPAWSAPAAPLPEGSFTAEGFCFDGFADGTAIITGYEGDEEDLAIPAVLNGYRVTEIGESAFDGQDALLSVVIPEGVVAIGEYAFNDCDSLGSVELPEGLTHLEDRAFCGCSALTGITLPASLLRLGEGAFFGCDSLVDVLIPENATDVGDNPFSACSRLQAIRVSAKNPTLRSIGGVLYNKAADTLLSCPGGIDGPNFEVPERVRTIGVNAFSGCRKLHHVILYDGITSIGQGAFYDCKALEGLTFPKSVTRIEDQTFWFCEGLIRMEIPGWITSIGEYAFGSCSKLGGVVIPASVTSIHDKAFDHCPGSMIVSVQPRSYAETFCRQHNIKYVQEKRTAAAAAPEPPAPSFQDAPFTSGDYLCQGHADGTAMIIKYTGNDGELAIPAVLNGYRVTEIGERAFFRCKRLTGVTLPDSVTSIGDGAFSFCDSLSSVMLPDSVTSIGKQAFWSSLSLTSIVLPDSVISIGDEAFRCCSNLTDVTLPNSVTSIGKWAFCLCTSLIGIILPDSVTNIGDEIFAHCAPYLTVTVTSGSPAEAYCLKNGIRTVVLKAAAASVRSFEEGSFSAEDFRFDGHTDGTAVITGYEGKAKDLTIPAELNGYRVTEIGEWAFVGNESLTSITIPDSVVSINDNPFSFCAQLAEICVSSSHPFLMMQDDALFTKEDQQLICYPCGRRTAQYAIPQGTRRIGCNAFTGCPNLTSIKLPDSVIDIGERAFSSCDSLTSILIPESVCRIGSGAFASCFRLSSVDILGHITKIEEETFAGTNLTIFIIPEGVSSIGDRVFSQCKFLSRITIPRSVTSIGEEAFSDCAETLTATVFPGSYAERYCKENRIKVAYPQPEPAPKPAAPAPKPAAPAAKPAAPAQPANDEFVQGNCRYRREADGTLTVVKYMGKAAMVSFPAVVEGRRVTRIGESAFNSNVALQHIAVPESVAEIGDYAFALCKELASVVLPNGLKTIGDNAFKYCGKLAAITLPAGITRIGREAFAHCSPSLTVTAEPGSYAEQYCKTNGIKLRKKGGFLGMFRSR